jgi:hypothetical protein
MMKQNQIFGVFLHAFLLTALPGCSTTSLTDSWQSPTLQRKAFDHVLVVGMLPSGGNRVLFERGFIETLESKGIQATASYDVIGDARPTRESVMQYLSTSDTRYVVVAQFGGMQITKERVPESVRTYYAGPYYPTFGGYWDQNTITLTRESYVDQTTNVLLTTSIYDAKTQDLAWVGRSKTFEVSSIVYEANDLARQIVNSIKN